MSASENTQHHLESFVISATLACNLRCMHCYVNAGEPAQYEVSTEELISAVDQAINLGAASFTFTGGEVFLRKDLLEVLRFVADRGCSIGFETNGTLLTEEKVQTLVDIDPNIFFAISLDGITRHTHEAFRGVPGCFDLTMRGICNVAKMGARLQIITVINTSNVQELPAIYDFSQNAVGAVSRFLLISPEG